MSTFQPLERADEDLLQSALSSSFTQLPSRPSTSSLDPLVPLDTRSPAAAAAPEPALKEASSSSAVDPDKEEYDRKLAAWRAEADVARAKAERTRAEWEVRRKAEEEEERRLSASRGQVSESSFSGWESVSRSNAGSQRVPLGDTPSRLLPGTSTGGGVGTSNEQASADRVAAANHAIRQNQLMSGGDMVIPTTSPANSRDFVPSERSRSATTPGLQFPFSLSASPVEQITPSLDTMSSEEEDVRIRQWEEVPSLASSFPSLPETSETSSLAKHSPKTGAQSQGSKDRSLQSTSQIRHQQASHPGHKTRGHLPTPPSLTLSVFNSDLPLRTRALALLSSLTINMFLPFVNGVMLGFGEIFARTIIAPMFGWRPTVGVASVGIRAADAPRRR